MSGQKIKLLLMWMWIGLWSGGAIAQPVYSNDLWLDINCQSTCRVLTVHAPEGFTKRVEIYYCDNLRPGDWTVVTENLRPTRTEAAIWNTSDTGPVGYFVAGNMDVDSDTDGLPDAQEKFVRRTDPSNPDSDDDGFSDGLEVERMTDPQNNTFANRIIYVSPIGYNTDDGYSDVQTDGHGPKRNILDGLQSALPGDIVQIVAEGAYTGNVWKVEKRTILTLRERATIP